MNIHNLTPYTSEQSRDEAVKNGKKSGIASGQARREAKAFRTLLNQIFDTEISEMQSNTTIAKYAQKYGVSSDKSIKELLVVACCVNSLEKADLKDLKILTELLGETADISNNEADKQTAFLEAIKNAVSA